MWPDSFVEEAALNRSVSVLRKRLGEDQGGQKYIETVPKSGYRFVGRSPRATRRSPLHQPFQSARERLVHPDAGRSGPPGDVVAGVWFAWRRPVGAERSVSRLPAPVHRQVTFTGKEGAPTVSPAADASPIYRTTRPRRH